MRIASTQYHSTMNTALQNATGKLPRAALLALIGDPSH